MALFRPVRGSLEDSLSETCLVETKIDLLLHVKKILSDEMMLPTDFKIEIEIKPYPDEHNSFDKRIGWFTHIVMVSYKQGYIDVTIPVGYLSENLK